MRSLAGRLLRGVKDGPLSSISGQRVRYCVAAVDAGLDRDPRAYLFSNEDLIFLRSPRSLMFKAETASELTSEVLSLLPLCPKDARRTMDILDLSSTMLCLTLDACEATKSIHPRTEYTLQAKQAQNYLDNFTASLNSNRALYEPVMRLCEPEVWAELTQEQRQFVKVMKEEMESAGVHLSPARTALCRQLFVDMHLSIQAALDSETQGQDPTAMIGELLSTRHEVATVIGFDSYASWAMRNAALNDPLDVWRMLLSFANRLQEGAKEEVMTLIEHKGKMHASRRSTGPVYVIKDFELKDFSKMIVRDRYGTPQEDMVPYLSIQNIWNGITMMCKDLFNLTLRKVDMQRQEQYDQNVVKYQLFNSNDELLGTIYADLIKRPGKAHGSGHFTVQLGNDIPADVTNDLDLILPESNRLQPIVVFACSCEGVFADASETVSGWDKVLATPNDAVSMFHEFGHALHTLVGQTKYQVLSGTRSSLDYVEVWSQLCESYARDYRSLRQWAVHHEDGTHVPRELVDRLNSSESAFSCLVQLEEILTACVDLVYHGPRPMVYCTLNESGELQQHEVPHGQEGPIEIRRLLSDLLTPIEVTELGSSRAHLLQQLMNYPATYYSYTYSRMIATVIWNTHLRDEPFNLTAGKKIREVMEKGASASPRALLSELVEDLSPEGILKQIG
eukprot:TRINITY_DN28313_c0_g1_i1.p1 TRINITY_DN28313_c0_g1~~TRINITY_DN28313_c0_g1_i1.p1  ORF type:complete len:687 (+),score=275.90 TRINITY_DN28313_c0_g1_i1:36-2063(+)